VIAPKSATKKAIAANNIVIPKTAFPATSPVSLPRNLNAFFIRPPKMKRRIDGIYTLSLIRNLKLLIYVIYVREPRALPL